MGKTYEQTYPGWLNFLDNIDLEIGLRHRTTPSPGRIFIQPRCGARRCALPFQAMHMSVPRRFLGGLRFVSLCVRKIRVRKGFVQCVFVRPGMFKFDLNIPGQHPILRFAF